jgi:hypothetical protein
VKKLLLFAAAIAVAYYYTKQPAQPPHAAVETVSGWQSGAEVEDSGTVTKILGDDSLGDRHQRFILRLASGQTVLVAHNIDLAPRVEPLQVGDTVAFRGEFEWNEKGGVIHWTHRDPQGRHAGGWLKHDGRTFE